MPARASALTNFAIGLPYGVPGERKRLEINRKPGSNRDTEIWGLGAWKLTRRSKNDKKLFQQSRPPKFPAVRKWPQTPEPPGPLSYWGILRGLLRRLCWGVLIPVRCHPRLNLNQPQLALLSQFAFSDLLSRWRWRARGGGA